MRVFDHFPEKGKCLVCNTNEDAPCVLVPVVDSGDGMNYEAMPAHVACLHEAMDNLWYDSHSHVLCMELEV